MVGGGHGGTEACGVVGEDGGVLVAGGAEGLFLFECMYVCVCVCVSVRGGDGGDWVGEIAAFCLAPDRTYYISTHNTYTHTHTHTHGGRDKDQDIETDPYCLSHTQTHTHTHTAEDLAARGAKGVSHIINDTHTHTRTHTHTHIHTYSGRPCCPVGEGWVWPWQ